ncbi:MAG: acetyltransferase [Bacteroidales bacterium]|jgi:sugar O-acyltransferase (sialic acid O-acetyltransferase NeuD family)|nr:acetyltransferase [Bacteroidales bacterium]
MQDIAIFGAGGFGREILTLIQDVNRVSPVWNVVGFFDDGYPKGEIINGFETLGTCEDLNAWEKPLAITLAIGTPHIKKNILSRITNPRVSFPTLIHPSVLIGDRDFVEIGKGCIICAANIITTNIEIGNFVILNLACTTGHDTVIKDYAAFMPTCNISGEVVIEEGVYCGTGVKIINRTSIGANTIVGAGAVVAKPLPPNCTAVGVPAKPIKFREA